MRALYRSVSRRAAPALARLRDRSLPQCCLLCGGGCVDALCAPCDHALRRVAPDACPRCQLPSVHGQVCGRCLKRPPVWNRLWAPWQYEFPFDAALLAAKYQHAFAVYRWAAAHAAAAITPPTPPAASALIAPQAWPFAPDATLLPVPLAPARLQARGYNQALLIAREFARHFDAARLRVDHNAVIRIRETGVQQRLNWIERRRNVRGAFAATRSLDGAAVVLVDDVLTTGATLNELARVVLAAGARSVDALVLARVQPLRRRDRVTPFGRAVA